MKLIQNTINELDLTVQLAEYEVELNEQRARYAAIPLEEADEVSDPVRLAALFDETTRMMDAAKRGLGLTNKLKDSASRTRFRHRVMGNMNRIRAKLNRITKAIDQIYGDRDEDHGRYRAGEHPGYEGPYDAAMMDPESQR